MAAPSPTVAEAFRRLQSGDAAGALECARRVVAEQPGNARAHLAAGIALRLAGRYGDSSAAIQRAQELDPRDHAAQYEAGVLRQLEGDATAALDHFERCARLRPDFFAAHFSAGLIRAERREFSRAAECFRTVLALQPDQPDALLHLAMALDRDGRHSEAEATFVHALAANPHHPATVRVFGQYSAARGNFKRAATLFAEALRLEPHDTALPMFVAQCELLLGRWPAAWAAYARREPRRAFELASAANGVAYMPARLDTLGGREVTLVGEQGLGDTLFFLRWAPAVRAAGARLAFAGDTRLHGLLARTKLFDRLDPPEAASAAPIPMLVGDLPAASDLDPASVPSLAIAPLPERVAAWAARLADTPRPWIGVQWRAGTPHEKVAHALSKSVPLETLFPAIAALPGTLLALQREPAPGELARAAAAARRSVKDLTHANNDLEDLLAVASLLDRHIAVSSTTVHLAAAAGATADILVPFPPEWRWRLEGASPWFPGFRIHRQRLDGDWSAALAALRAAAR